VKTIDAVTLGLATTRLTQLVVDDAITEPLRLAIDKKASEVPAGSFTDWVDTGINCHACVSVWAGGGILAAEQTRLGRSLVRVLALSQAALAVKSVIERIDR
jgi:hypothetical protein